MKVNIQILPKTGDIHPLIAYLAIIGSCRKVGIIIEIPVTCGLVLITCALNLLRRQAGLERHNFISLLPHAKSCAVASKPLIKENHPT